MQVECKLPSSQLKSISSWKVSPVSSSKDPVNLGGTGGYVRRFLDASYVDGGPLWNERWAARVFPVPSLKEDEELYFL